MENLAFTERAIKAAQRLSIEHPFCRAIHEYLMRQKRVGGPCTRGLTWVLPTKGPQQVAVWVGVN